MSELVSALMSLDIQGYITLWVSFGAFTGACISGFNKVEEISKEPEMRYDNPIFEKPIQAVYHTSRVAGHTGLGAFVGGATALTAPVSIPAYVYWKSLKGHQE